MPDSINFNSKTDLYRQIKDNKVSKDTVPNDTIRAKAQSLFNEAFNLKTEDNKVKNDTVLSEEAKAAKMQSLFNAMTRSAAKGVFFEAFIEYCKQNRLPIDSSLVNIKGAVPYKEDSVPVSHELPYEPAESPADTTNIDKKP